MIIIIHFSMENVINLIPKSRINWGKKKVWWSEIGSVVGETWSIEQASTLTLDKLTEWDSMVVAGRHEQKKLYEIFPSK